MLTFVMFELSSLTIFMTAAIGLLIVPSPAVTFIIARSIEHGRLAGFVVNLFNPKSTLFLFAFLSQFIVPERGNPTLQIVLLGFLFVGLVMVSDSIYVLLASAARHLLSGNIKMARFQKNFAGVIYIVPGLSTAVTGQQK